jgi:hypothetical protein
MSSSPTLLTSTHIKPTQAVDNGQQPGNLDDDAGALPEAIYSLSLHRITCGNCRRLIAGFVRATSSAQDNNMVVDHWGELVKECGASWALQNGHSEFATPYD